MNPILRAHELGKNYGRRQALTSTSLEIPPGLIAAEHTDRQSTFIVRTPTPLPPGDWNAEPLDLEDLVLTYMEQATEPTYRSPARAGRISEDAQ